MTGSDPREIRKPSPATGLRGVGVGRLAIAAVVVILTLAALGVMAVPIGPAADGYGVVRTLGSTKTDTGSKPYALVWIGDREVRISVDRRDDCRAGDRIRVRSQKTLFGERHRAGPNGCEKAGL